MKKELPLKVISGDKLMARWSMSPPDLFCMMVKHKLRSVHREPFEEEWIEDYWDDLLRMILKEKDDIGTFTFLLPDVRELEDRNKELTSKSTSLVRGKELMERWSMDSSEFLDTMESCSLCPVDPLGVSLDSLDQDSMLASGFAEEADLLFKLGDVGKIEKEYDLGKTEPIGVKKLRPNQRHKLECRKVAEAIWKKDPTITIAGMAVCNEIFEACEEKMYEEKTIRDWVKDLCPNREPGRRPKKDTD